MLGMDGQSDLTGQNGLRHCGPNPPRIPPPKIRRQNQNSPRKGLQGGARGSKRHLLHTGCNGAAGGTRSHGCHPIGMGAMGDGSPDGMGCKAVTPHMGWMPNGAGMALQSGGGRWTPSRTNPPAGRKLSQPRRPAPFPALGSRLMGLLAGGNGTVRSAVGLRCTEWGTEISSARGRGTSAPRPSRSHATIRTPLPPPPPRRSPPSRRAQHPKEGQPPLPTPLTPPCSTTSVQ